MIFFVNKKKSDNEQKFKNTIRHEDLKRLQFLDHCFLCKGNSGVRDGDFRLLLFY